jgi:sulfur carrier protein
MNVTINGSPHELAEGTSLAAAVSLLTAPVTGVAAAINGAVMRRTEWEGTDLADGDSVEVITAVQGG